MKYWKVKNFRPGYFFKECLSLYVTGTVPVPFRQTFPPAVFFPFSFYIIVNRRSSRWRGKGGKGWEGGGGLRCPFFENWKKSSDLRKNALTVHFFRLSFSFNLSFSILRVSRSQNSKIFPCEVTFLCLIRQMFIEMHWFQIFLTFSLNQ